MAIKKYTSLYRIKDFLMTNIAPKYLEKDQISIATVGLFGYITESLSVLGEDALNSTSIVFKECFANAAENMESLHLMSAIYQLDNYWASAATLSFVLIVKEDDILSAKTANGITSFFIDRNTRFDIDDKSFSLEYDIKITAKRTPKGYLFNAQYIIDLPLTFSSITSPYIRTKSMVYNGERYLALLVKLRQMKVHEFEETIITNDKINYCAFEFDIRPETNIVGFEATYQSPEKESSLIQLAKRIENTPKIDSPFCFYTVPDEGILRISFSNDERYFIPEFNSVVKVRVYTTDGESGNFKKYTGNSISIITTGEKYEENNGLILFGQCYGDSSGGKNSPTIEEFRSAVIAAQSTVLSYSTESDLNIFFKRVVDAGNTQIMFMKRRDDSLIRLFNAFTLLKDENDIIIPTNTADIMIEEEDIDEYYLESYRTVLKAGKLYKYSEKFEGFLCVDNEHTIHDDLDDYENDFIYTNPFLSIMSSRPVNIGLYLNSIDTDVYLDTDYVNEESFIQFMPSGIHIYRNAVLNEDEFVFTVNLLPNTTIMDTCVTMVHEDTLITSDTKIFYNEWNETEYIDNERFKLVLAITDNGVETSLLEFHLVGFNDSYYIFEARLKTDDFVSANNKMNVLESVKDASTMEVLSEKLIPSYDILANLYIFYKYDDIENTTHKWTSKGLAEGYTLTNIYNSQTNRIDLIKPLNLIRAELTYHEYVDNNGNDSYNYLISSIPLVKANYIKSPELFHKFVNNLNTIYDYLNGEIHKLTNNFSIDIKFYNTYGRSRHYIVDASSKEIAAIVARDNLYLNANESDGDLSKLFLDPNDRLRFETSGDKTFLDKINLSLKFGVKPYYTTDVDNLIEDIKQYIIMNIKSDFDLTGNNYYYNSNMIRKIETDFADKIEFVVFKGINSYPLEIQTLVPLVTSENLHEYYDAMYNYVPEYVNIYYKIKSGKMIPQIQIDII